jgi:hypothetical protein
MLQSLRQHHAIHAKHLLFTTIPTAPVVVLKL